CRRDPEMSVTHPLSPADAARDLAGLRVQLAAAPEAAELRPLGLGGLLLGPGVLERVTDVVRELRRAGGGGGVLADGRAMASPRGEVKSRVSGSLTAAGLPVRRVSVGDDDGQVHLDAATIGAALEASEGASVVVSVGSGTIVDLGKAVSARLGG